MLSAKGRVCGNKVYILNKMQTLRDRLKGYIDQGSQKVQKREADEAAAKSAWLDAESEYILTKKKAEDSDAIVAEDLKKVASLATLLDLNKARLSKVRASVTEQLSEIDEEEAIIKELLGYISDLHSSTVDVVSAFV
jgi:flagellar biosynthesis chaperone FliJ